MLVFGFPLRIILPLLHYSLISTYAYVPFIDIFDDSNLFNEKMEGVATEQAPKTPPSYYAQRVKLERAKISDILKHKIEYRPDKQQLVSQHILLEPAVTAMDVVDDWQNGSDQQTVFQRAHFVTTDAPTPNVTSVTTSPLPSNGQNYQHHQRLPFLQAANTLAVHEEVLRQQQKKIEEIQKELQKSQELLRQQQQMMLAAKQMQSEASETGVSDIECILNQLDTKQIQKAHIQLFLQQKIQQQQLQQQINVQQELMEIQQKFQEEMTVHQALNDVVRLLREEPRVSVLILCLLRRHQVEQQQQQHSEQMVTTPTAAAPQPHQPGDGIVENGESLGVDIATLMKQQQPQPQQYHRKTTPSPAALNASSNGQQCYENGHGCVSSDHASTPTAVSAQHVSAKNRQGSGQHPKKGTSQLSIVRANSVPTSPVKSKSSSSMGDMEEIFRTVLDYASKATEKGDSVNSVEPQQNGGTLPSFDQLLQPTNPVSHIETAVSITSGSGILMTSCHSQPHQLAVLNHSITTGSLQGRRFSNAADTSSACSSKSATTDFIAVNETAPLATAFTYTRNEAFDDLMEVLRDNDAPLSDAGTNECLNEMNTCSSFGSSNDNSDSTGASETVLTTPNGGPVDVVVSQAQQQLNLLSAFGAEEVADLLGMEWFNVESLLPHSSCAEAVMRHC